MMVMLAGLCPPQGALEVLRHWCSASAWHDEASSQLREVVDTQLLACYTTSPHAKP